jgi:cytochrome c
MPRLNFRGLGALAVAAAGLAALSMGSARGEPLMRGKLLFLQCASCHDVTPGASAKIGPSLYGVVGRHAGSLPGYAYSQAMKTQTFVWDEKMLDRWLTKPTDVVPGTAMAFGGVAKAEDRQAIIAYLRQTSP